MFLPSATFCLLVAAAVSATNVKQCPGKSVPNISKAVHLSPCNKLPCNLKRNSNENIEIHFTPQNDVTKLNNKVSAKIIGLDLPFIGVDGMSVCDKIYNEDSQKVGCPLKAGNKYIYKDSFPILPAYPPIQADVSWSLIAQNQESVLCFIAPIKIT